MASFFDAVKKAVVCTPNLNPDNEAYDAGVLAPYARIEKMAAEVKDSPSDAEIAEALALLKTIFDTKRVDLTEQKERFEEILDPLGKGAMSPLPEDAR